MSSCAYHPERDVVGACVNCGKLVCAECKTTIGGKIYCNPCIDKELSGIKEFSGVEKTSGEKESAGVTENTSDQDSLDVIPKEIQGWNWGAFLLNWIWGIGNGVWIALLALIPFVGFIMAIVLGAGGNRWAWQKKRWDGIEHFKRVQRTWARWGVGLTICSLVILVPVMIANWDESSGPTDPQPSTQPAPTPLVPLGRVQISPEAVTIAPGGVQQFSAKAFDKNNNEIKDFTSRWTVAEGGGRVYENGIFVASTEAGSYKDTVKLEAIYDGSSETVAASVIVTTLPTGQTLIFTPTMPAHVPGLGYLIYEDDFSNNSGWSEYSKDGREYYLKDGVYHMIVPSGFNSAWASGASLSQLGDFSLEVTLSRMSGPQDSEYGITFEIGDTGQRGFILINYEGQIYFWKNEGQGTYVNSIKVFEGPITTGTGEYLDKVKLGVERQGTQWKVSVNDSLVISVLDTAEPLTRVGFMVGENLHATFDNLKIYAVAPTVPPSAPTGFMVFSDTFVDGWNRGWFLDDNGYLQDGALHLLTTGNKYLNSFNERIPELDSFAYSAELYFKEAQSQANGSIGLGKEQGRVYFKIWPIESQFQIYYYSFEEGWDLLNAITYSEAIKGLGEVNELLVIGRDSSLEFYVNDVFLGSFADPNPDSPIAEIGLRVMGEGSHAVFDNVALYTLSPLPVSQVTFPTAISGDPPFSSDFGPPTQARIGPFTTQIGDYFVSYTMTDAELSALQADYSSAPIRKGILDAVEANFKDRVDVVIVILDLDAPPQGSLPWGVNYSVQSGSLHNPTTPRFARLGNMWLMTRDGLDRGPALHELLHGFLKSMAQDSKDNFIITTVLAGHWGFSSVGGQLGGWDKDTLVYLGNDTYQATGPPKSSGSYPTSFGIQANGGNSIPYSNLELWAMGLIPDSELISVDVAENASYIEAGEGKFTATAIRTYSPSELIARTISDNRPSSATPRAFRGLVVFATTRTTIDVATITQLNTDIEEFSMRSSISGSHNFWTATGMRASIHLATASELAR